MNKLTKTLQKIFPTDVPEKNDTEREIGDGLDSIEQMCTPSTRPNI